MNYRQEWAEGDIEAGTLLDAIDELQVTLAMVRGLLVDCRETIVHGDFATGICCCGSLVDSHGFGDGHSPVDSGDYHVGTMIQCIDEALTASKENPNV